MGLQTTEPFNLIARIDADAVKNATARRIIARPDDHPTPDVVTACERLLTIPGDWLEFERARLLLAAIRREEGVAA